MSTPNSFDYNDAIESVKLHQQAQEKADASKKYIAVAVDPDTDDVSKRMMVYTSDARWRISGVYQPDEKNMAYSTATYAPALALKREEALKVLEDARRHAAFMVHGYVFALLEVVDSDTNKSGGG